MAEIKSYPIGTPSLDDYLIGTEGPSSEANGSTKNYTISDIKDIIGSGSEGPQGPIGPAGAAGADGQDGAQGPAGADGTSIRILGTVANCTGLPSVGNTVGDVYILDADDPVCSYGAGLAGDGYTWTAGSTWLNVGPLRGPQGIQGTTGPQGATGPQGPQGIQGNTGATGNGINSTTGRYYDAGGVPIPPGDTIPADAQYKVTFDYTDLTTFTTDDIRGADGATNPQYDNWVLEDDAATTSDIEDGDKVKIAGAANEVNTTATSITGGYQLEIGLDNTAVSAGDYTFPSGFTVDSKGRLTSVTQGQIADFVRTNEDTYTNVNAVQQIITLTNAEYTDPSFSPDDSYLYIIVG
jgi:hypothetical protein